MRRDVASSAAQLEQCARVPTLHAARTALHHSKICWDDPAPSSRRRIVSFLVHPEFIGFVGVALLLIAFFLNLFRLLKADSLPLSGAQPDRRGVGVRLLVYH
jgi:hypothetical protein